jgi:fido (protein-threonine AMPylation protein)
MSPQSASSMLAHAISVEAATDWTDNDADYVVGRISSFTRQLWLIHPFSEGNTRTVAAFIGKYLDSLGFDVGNETFRDHSLYYRNALVRACYRNVAKGVRQTDEFLARFYQNLLYRSGHSLRNRDLFVLELAPKGHAPDTTA